MTQPKSLRIRSLIVSASAASGARIAVDGSSCREALAEQVEAQRLRAFLHGLAQQLVPCHRGVHAVLEVQRERGLEPLHSR